MTVIEIRAPDAAPRRGWFLPRISPAIWSPVLAVLLWQGCAMLGLMDARFFPAPLAIVLTLAEVVQTGQFWSDLAFSFERLAVGFLLGAIPGALLGLSMGMLRPVRNVFRPLILALYPIPKIAIFPLILLIFGLGEWSKYVIVALAVFFVMVINAMAGVLDIPAIYFDVARDLRASRSRIYFTVALPGALPGLFTGLRLAVGTSLLVLISAEFVGAQSGVGYRIWWSWSVFWVENMYAGLAEIALIGYGLSLLVDVAERRLLPWRS
jgi:ABC-type nitrate/sulfonate/bicarbonate transport system permease component